MKAAQFQRLPKILEFNNVHGNDMESLSAASFRHKIFRTLTRARVYFVRERKKCQVNTLRKKVGYDERLIRCEDKH
jgi:hypothetical protein